MPDTGTRRMFRAQPQVQFERDQNHRATYTARRLKPSTLLVTVEGEVDGTNHRALALYVERNVAGSTHVVLDLRLVDFFGTAGFAALHNVNVICSRYGIAWTLRAGRQVRRLLAICDPDVVLPLEAPQSVLDDLHAGAGDRELLVGRNH